MQHFPHLHTFVSLQQKAVFLRNLTLLVIMPPVIIMAQDNKQGGR